MFFYGALFIACLIYLIFRNKLIQINNLTIFQESNILRFITHIIFIISIFLSIWVTVSKLYYYRPFVYFVFLLMAAASIILDIIWLNEKIE